MSSRSLARSLLRCSRVAAVKPVAAIPSWHRSVSTVSLPTSNRQWPGRRPRLTDHVAAGVYSRHGQSCCRSIYADVTDPVTLLSSALPHPFYVQRRSMFIQTETTPNVDSLKFIPGSAVSTSGTHEFLDAGSASSSPLADRLFHLPGVKTLFFGPDFISVNKHPDASWADVKPEVYSIIMEHFTSGTPLFRDGRDESGPEDTRILDSDSEVVAMIKELLDTRVRPAIQEDGGDIEYRGFDEEAGRVELSLKGSCRGCDSSTVTLKNGIERMLMHYVPEVKEVLQVLGPEEEVAIDEFAKFERE
ncbi:BZ3500_MvSof-1268-A1-R1_Chr1-1g01081 [Microbotryum saponariae]|uniref:BZ3500_MvSof-1268-A1-R1_Chr1-1g01081 protein n=1 Tax=Microbotryum saponariae TaxID=289078 RepID=A0A2X0KPJ3_9BASI|nr:BZ3500_MvSof-1268-A1-R1_Chr1-1g01081 [Microbotryum saponariae]SCZ93366.1 BZ3501_MvSof-1269-A2-R1_Chr1-1g00678 [Microbotryum saponariae]